MDVLSRPAESQAAHGIQCYVARQPIFGTDHHPKGYELLYRNNAASTGAATAGVSERAMSTETVLRSVLGLGITQLTGGRKAWMNFTGELIKERVYELLPKEQVVIEVLEHTIVDDALVSELARMQANGWELALDDFELSPGTARLLPYAKYLKVVVRELSNDRVLELGRLLHGWGKVLLAEQVETREVRDLCEQAGFSLFQGYYFSRPQLVSKKVLATAKLSAMRLLQQLRNPDEHDSRIVNTIGTDVALTYKLLQLVNSAATGGRGIESLEHALRLLGRAALTKWASLLLVSSLVSEDGTSREVAHVAMRRARFGEKIAQTLGRRDEGLFFLVGLFSLLDALLDRPMEEAVEPLDLSDEVKRALVTGHGTHALLLQLAESFERGAWDEVDLKAEALGISKDDLLGAYTEAEYWAYEQLVRTT